MGTDIDNSAVKAAMYADVRQVLAAVATARVLSVNEKKKNNSQTRVHKTLTECFSYDGHGVWSRLVKVSTCTEPIAHRFYSYLLQVHYLTDGKIISWK